MRGVHEGVTWRCCQRCQQMGLEPDHTGLPALALSHCLQGPGGDQMHQMLELHNFTEGYETYLHVIPIGTVGVLRKVKLEQRIRHQSTSHPFKFLAICVQHLLEVE